MVRRMSRNVRARGIGVGVGVGVGEAAIGGGAAVNLDFVLTVETTAPSETFLMNTSGSGSYNCNVDWGDGSDDDITTYDDGAWTHTYDDAGTHTITISGTFTKVGWNGGGDCLKVRTIENMGIVGWTSINKGFMGCSGMTDVNFGDNDMSACTDWGQAFDNTNALVSFDMGSADFSNVTIANLAFDGVDVPIQNWTIDGSVLTNVNSMCRAYSTTTIDVSKWTNFPGNLTSISGFFRDAGGDTSFTGMEDWDTSGVSNFNGCFRGINGAIDISAWNFEAATDLASMFLSAPGLIQADYDALLISLSGQTLTSSLSVHFGSSVHTTGGAAEAAKDDLVDNDLWVIVDGMP